MNRRPRLLDLRGRRPNPHRGAAMTHTPGPGGTPLDGLEIWLNGTPIELDTAARVLSQIGRIVHHGRRTALTGTDTGRWHTYVRIHVPIGKPQPTTPTR